MTEDNKIGLIVQEAASFKFRNGKQEEAARLFEELVRSHGRIEAIVGLITTVARVDIEKVEAHAKKLKPLPGLKGVDVDSLEKTSGAKQEGSYTRVGIGDVHVESKSKEKAKKRKRRPWYPKGFDPSNPGPPPDPERWLPMRERSSYRPKRKDKRAAQVRGSQGTVVREKQEARAGANSSSPNTKSSQTGSFKGGQHSSGAEQPKPCSKSSRKKSRS